MQQLEFRDKDGKALTLDEWQALGRDREYCELAKITISIPGTNGGVMIKTKWTGGGPLLGEPSLFVTQIFGAEIKDIPSNSEQEAIATHNKVVANYQGLATVRIDLLDQGGAPILVGGAL